MLTLSHTFLKSENFRIICAAMKHAPIAYRLVRRAVMTSRKVCAALAVPEVGCKRGGASTCKYKLTMNSPRCVLTAKCTPDISAVPVS
jgi:hypothetical protein